ncbi:Rieske 2Fe-2S domain-containing protein [Actinopolyspora saharensis]|uniref:Rieske 2Fe-2S domain-containing protein n=1 Tax=Actinopolyspora saharensis TaxID=995062 RepID=UPI003F675DA7
MRPFSALDRIAEWSWLDKPASALRDAVFAVLRNRRFRDVLHGVWLGHPVHPMLVQAPVGAFLSAGVLDASSDRGAGERRAAESLIGLGVVTSLPATLAGAADFAQGHEEQQRTGLVHAATNGAALASYVLSLRWRAGGRDRAGVLAGWTGLALIAAGGLLGGHLSYHQSTGVNHADAVPHVAPEDWTDLGALSELRDRVPSRRMVGEVPVVVVRDGAELHVLADRCSHASGPLSDGTLSWRAGSSGNAPCLQCPWHGSVFRLSDGGVEHGPATAPQPTFHTRVVGGRVQARVRRIPGVPAGG